MANTTGRHLGSSRSACRSSARSESNGSPVPSRSSASSAPDRPSGFRDSFGSFEEFWPYYVAMHAKAATRWVHLAGTLTGLAVGAYGLARGRKRHLAALPLFGYGAAWPAHFLIEGNNPATFGHPAWSLRGDVRMIATMLAGRDKELGETAAAWLAEHPRR
jgi:hypothetical protein